MSDTLLIILIIIGTGAVIMLIKYFIYKLFDKAGDAVRNKMVEKRNAESKGPESLADRYKDVPSQAEEPVAEKSVEPEVESTPEEKVEEVKEEPVAEEDKKEE